MITELLTALSPATKFTIFLVLVVAFFVLTFIFTWWIMKSSSDFSVVLMKGAGWLTFFLLIYGSIVYFMLL